MSEATNFRLYADEALHESFKTVREEEKRALEDLACTWAAAALASDRIFGPTTTSWSPADKGATASRGSSPTSNAAQFDARRPRQFAPIAA
jgi:hypothetical protein